MIMIDDFEDRKFGYRNKDGYIEYVEIINNDTHAMLVNDVGHNCALDVEDIPKMIKALQAAYDYSKK